MTALPIDPPQPDEDDPIVPPSPPTPRPEPDPFPPDEPPPAAPPDEPAPAPQTPPPGHRHDSRSATDLTNAGASWVDEKVVVEDELVSSRAPDDLPAFCDAIVDEFSCGGNRSR